MRSALMLCVALIASRATAQATVSGVVRDSIAGGTLAGAVVQLVGTDSASRFDRSVVSDAIGRFAFTNVPNGRFTLGFMHPILDSLGLEPVQREVSLHGERTIRADLGVPSPSRLRAAICGAQAEDSSAVIVGFVRSARDRAVVASAEVKGEWHELTFTDEGVSQSTPLLKVLTAGNGWFALCNVPSSGMVWLSAGFGADSSGPVEVEMSGDGFARRELYLGSAQNLVRLSGTVMTAAGKRPIAGAVVSLGDGSMARSDDRGEWSLPIVPTGSQMLEVRAVGYYPERRAVDVVADAVVRTELPTVGSVLDTVTVRATAVGDRNMRGFEERRRGSGSGRFLTADVIGQRNAQQASDLFRMTPGVFVHHDNIVMRGAFGGCSPSLYVDGALVNAGEIVNPGAPKTGTLKAADIDLWARPEDIAGIEIYPTQPPVQFQRALSRCGSIVVWLKPPKVNLNARPFKFRLVQTIVIAGLMVVIATLIQNRSNGY
jgi:hypothetical protein